MGYSQLVQYIDISPKKTSPRNAPISGISIHCMAANLTLEACGRVFHNRDASSNYGIDSSGKIGLYVDENDRSWCTSSRDVDNRCVTIEVACEAVHPYKVTEAALRSLIVLCTDICRRHGLTLKWQNNKALLFKWELQNMVPHRWMANKACPGDYLYERYGYIAEEINKALLVTEEKDDESTKPVVFVSTQNIYLRTSPGFGDDNKIKFGKLDKAMKKKCHKDANGYAVFSMDERYTRIAKHVGSKGGIWHKNKRGYWLCHKSPDGTLQTKKAS